MIARAPLGYAGEVSTFAGEITPPEGGTMELVVLAAQPEEANFGRAWREIEVSPAEGTEP